MRKLFFVLAVFAVTITSASRCTSDDPVDERVNLEEFKKQNQQYTTPPKGDCPDKPGADC